MSELALPDCRLPDPFRLTPAQREALARALLTHGVEKGLDSFLRKHGDRANLNHAREALLAELDEKGEQAVLEKDYSAELAELAAGFEEQAAQLKQRQSLLTRELENFDPLAGALTASDILARLVKPPELGRWRRFLIWLGRKWRRFLAWLARLFGRRGRRTLGRTRLLPTSLVLGGQQFQTEAAFEGLLEDPQTQLWLGRKASGRMAPPRIRDWWKRNFRPARYREEADRALKEELDRLKTEANKRQRAQKKELKQLRKAEGALEQKLEERKALAGKHHARAKTSHQRELEERARLALRKTVQRQALIAGLVEQSGARLLVSEALIASLGSRLYDELVGELSAPGPLTGLSSEDTGSYQRRPLMSQYELSRLDIVASVLNARLAHPDYPHLLDADLVVHTEERLASVHVVICVDISGSMAENNRLEAAKRAALALYGAVKAERESNRVDFITLSTRARRVGLRELWELESRGFTNTGAAVHLARRLLEQGRADRRLVYLITDGLPEAHVADSGQEVAGDLPAALAQARLALEDLSRLTMTKIGMLLLEPEDELFVNAARELAGSGQGRLLVTNPQSLVKDLVVDFMAEPFGGQIQAGWQAEKPVALAGG